MIIDIYTSSKNGSKYLSVPKGINVASLQVTADFDPDLLTLSPFKTRLELNPDKPRAALDQEAILEQIKAQGYAVHGAKIAINVGGA